MTTLSWQSLGSLVADAGLQGGLLLALTMLLAAALPRATAAATRHLVWGLGLVAAAVVFALAALPPRWTPLAAEARVDAVVVSAAPPTPIAIDNGPSTDPAAATAESKTAPSALAGHVAERAPEETAPTSAAAAPTLPSRVSVVEVLGLVWLGGAVLVLATGLVALAAALRRAHRTPPPSPEVQARLVRLARPADLDRVRTGIDARSRAPFTVGFLRPHVVFPADVGDWPDSRIRAALRHELAHVHRGDWLSRAVARAVVALHWWNPLAWFAESRLRFCSECACDDAALRDDVAPCDYADELVQMARGRRGGSVRAALSIAGGSQLEQRILALLDNGRRRRGASAFARWFAAGLVLGGAVPMGCTGVLRATSGGQDPAPAATNLQAAIDSTPEGGTVRIAAGSYAERLVIRKSITLEGAGARTTLVAMPYENPLAKDPQLAAKIAAEVAAAAPAEQRSLRARLLREHGPKPVLLAAEGAEVTVKGVRFSMPGKDDPDVAMPGAIVSVYGGRAQFENCAFVGCPANGVEIAGESSLVLRNCLVAAGAATGIQIAGRTARAEIIGCDVRDCVHRGITVGSGNSTTTITRCRISGSKWHGIRYDDAAPVIANNRIANNERCGIYASGKSQGTVTGNLFADNTLGAISCWFASMDRIENNTFVGAQSEGVAALGAAAPRLQKNLFHDQDVAVLLDDAGDGDAATSKSTGAIAIDGCVFSAVRQKVLWRARGAEPRLLAVAQQNGNREQAAQFVDAAHGDFELQAGSELQKAGIGAAAFAPATSPWEPMPEELQAGTAAGARRDPKAALDADEVERQRLHAGWARSKPWVDRLGKVGDSAASAAALAEIRTALRGNADEALAALLAIVQTAQVAYDKKPLRESILPWCRSLQGAAQMQAFAALDVTDRRPEDLALLLEALATPSPPMLERASYLLTRFADHDISGEVAQTLLRLLNADTRAQRRDVLGGIWGARVPDAVQARLLELAKDPSERHDAIYFGLSTLGNKNGDVVRFLLEVSAEPTGEDAHRALWGLQQGVAEADRTLVADHAVRLFEARLDSQQRSSCLQILRVYGQPAHAPRLRALAADPGLAQWRDELEHCASRIEGR